MVPLHITTQLFARHQSTPSFEESRALETIAVQEESASSTSQPIVISWNCDDSDNPRNWPKRYKVLVVFLISLYSFIVYCGSSIILPSYLGVMLRFQESKLITSFILSLYVFGYGAGALLFSPLSEIAFIGRNPPYILSFIIFTILSIVLGTIESFPALLIVRFLQGFFGSPCLATGGASITDVCSGNAVGYGYTVWVACIYAGPGLGPLIATPAVTRFNWHWSMWEVAIMAAPLLLLLLFFLPETSHDTILLRRAQRLRHLTKKQNIAAPSELYRHGVSTHVRGALVRPAEIIVKDPAIGFVCLYCSFIYGIYYSFFEAFPVVYEGIYGMRPILFAATFLASVIGTAIAIVLYVPYLRYCAEPLEALVSANRYEELVNPALPATVFTTIGLFIFAWTAHASINWAVPTDGIVLFAGSTFIIYQAMLLYIPQTYPRYVASLLAASDFTRSTTAAVIIMVSPYMYDNLGIGKGVSLLASISVLGIVGMCVLKRYGARMRAASRFAVDESSGSLETLERGAFQQQTEGSKPWLCQVDNA
ncbi:putative benomyl/methotrexate resistance protein [Aspergillus avenaceus]|uniref:Putative benomyl/methotrexate resistance protein n=1 Tax=Aspergillus avenaceus TaxID=36643 RepID=A0A5N6TDH3_ASPAV|nr:putative benomyl/methotrexate resistance protein [Aspergillus avenaceus]